ncbi:nucleotidyltransferase domain-containing protein [Anaerophaga thermohalophila]|uniref:nucleotidyltransferase domain-containing protein n=1 Tax=Anaerophaga thermohalophila TaxID=177400 RepID=UPI0002FA92FC|nr:nucleotidyltransferase domain-containing protein [Anaerophaga thermohalophila]
MRLSERERQSIKHAAKEVWGDKATLYLFGSRTDNSKKGGDIDLYIQLSEIKSPRRLIHQKAAFLSKLDILIGEQKIDVIINTPENEELPIVKTARKKGLIL